MGTGERTRVAAVGASPGANRRSRRASGSELAWLLVVPCAVVAVLAIVLLGPPLGGLLPGGSVTPWPSTAREFRPEPTEHARYAIALGAPLLLVAALVGLARMRPRIPRPLAWLVPALQLASGGFVVFCIAQQYRARVEGPYIEIWGTSPRTVYFTVRTLAVACAVGLTVAAVASSRGASRRVARLLRDTPARSAAAWTLAVLAIVGSLLPAIQLESTLLHANVNTWYHVAFTYDEASAVLDGRSPLVDFAAQYGSLWPYALALGMALFGSSVAVFCALAAALTGASLLAVYDVLRRLVASGMAALLLFLPLLATALYKMNGSLSNRFSLATLTGMFPLRLAGPFLLMWLLARHLHGAAPRTRWPLFLAAGLVVLNNVEFGLPAAAATFAALLWTTRPLRPALRRIAREAGVGLAAAFALVSVLTLLRAGSLPDLGLLVRYADLFAGSGFGMFPIVPTLGVSTIIFLTYVAAIGTATVRTLERAVDRLLTGLLVWSGVFGLGIGAYYVGRSHPEVLTNMFPAWALSIVLLTVAMLRDIAATRRPPAPGALLCLIGFGVLVCSLAQTPDPVAQVRRLEATTSARLTTPQAVAFIRGATRPGEPVAILTTVGHRLAVQAGVTDVTPYTGMESMPTREQLVQTLRLLRQAGGRKVIAAGEEAVPEAVHAVEQAGFRLSAVESAGQLVVLTKR